LKADHITATFKILTIVFSDYINRKWKSHGG